MRITSPLFVFAAVLSLGSCTKDGQIEEVQGLAPDEPGTYQLVDGELWPYFERFEVEAAERGITVDLNDRGVRGHIESFGEDGVAGDCRYEPEAPNVLRVDSTLWARGGDALREYVVFHELGHCSLVRKHRESADDDGVCRSIMASGTGECRENYSPPKREELLDELFDEQFFGDWE